MLFVEYAVFWTLVMSGFVFFFLDTIRGKSTKLPFEAYLRESRKCASSIESKLFNALWNRGHFIVTQYKISKYSLDMAIPSLKIAIEADGEFWHYSNSDQIAKDARRDEYLKSLGWVTLRFPGEKIKKDIMSCVWRVEAEIQQKQLSKNGLHKENALHS
jgi:very-short-patch-repair endonuclease